MILVLLLKLYTAGSHILPFVAILTSNNTPSSPHVCRVGVLHPVGAPQIHPTSVCNTSIFEGFHSKKLCILI